MKKNYLYLVAAGAALMGVADLASATAVLDFTSSVTAATTELTAAVSTGIGIFGTIVGVGVGIRMFKKFTRG